MKPAGGKNSIYQTFLCTSLLHRGMSGSQCIVVLVFDSKRSLLLVLQNSLSVTSIVAQFTAWHLGGDGGHGSGVFC